MDGNRLLSVFSKLKIINVANISSFSPLKRLKSKLSLVKKSSIDITWAVVLFLVCCGFVSENPMW